MSEFPNIEKLREAVSSEGRVVDQICDSFSNHTWVRLNLVNPIRRAFGAARFLLSVLDEGGRLEVVVPCERHGIIHERADGSECPYYGHHVCDKCGWIDPEHKGEYVSCGSW